MPTTQYVDNRHFHMHTIAPTVHIHREDVTISLFYWNVNGVVLCCFNAENITNAYFVLFARMIDSNPNRTNSSSRSFFLVHKYKRILSFSLCLSLDSFTCVPSSSSSLLSTIPTATISSSTTQQPYS